jgi:hypothetical protein
MSKRTIYLEMTIDWDDYDDVCDDLIIEDSGVLDSLKEGVTVKQIHFPVITDPNDPLNMENQPKE